MTDKATSFGFVILIFFSTVGIATDNRYSGKKVLFVDSYHEGYAWSDGIAAGIHSVLDNTDAELKRIEMDTKRNSSEHFKESAAAAAQAAIGAFKPDVVIACDDNASKYLIAPYYKRSDMPIVFCGVNWDASIYGYPFKNVTGIVETDFVPQLIRQLGKYAKGTRVGLLGDDTLTSRKIARYHRELLDIEYDRIAFAQTFEQWKKLYVALQDQVDRLIFINYAGISGWDEEQARKFVKRNTEIPSGTSNTWTMRFTLLGVIKSPEEQGRWAARAALEILDGTPTTKIPITHSRQGKLYFNAWLGDKLGITDVPAGAVVLK